MEEISEVSTSDNIVKVAAGCLEIDGEWVSPDVLAAQSGDAVVMIDTDNN